MTGRGVRLCGPRHFSEMTTMEGLRDINRVVLTGNQLPILSCAPPRAGRGSPGFASRSTHRRRNGSIGNGKRSPPFDVAVVCRDRAGV